MPTSFCRPYQGVDVIGDLHGHHAVLEKLLQQLGYRRDGDGWRHTERLAVFVGDLIDRGPQQLATLNTVRAMVEDSNALCIMGNHEFNALSYFMKDQDGRPLRPLSTTISDPHLPFLQAVGDGSSLHAYWAAWFLQLPLWLEMEGLSVVHACLDAAAMQCLRQQGLTAECCLTPELIRAGNTKGSPVYAALEVVCKGPETALPAGHSFADKDGKQRTRIRTRWWSDTATTYRDLALLDEEHRAAIPNTPLLQGICPILPPQPVCIGHYWLSPTAQPAPLSPRIACVDYSAGKGGPLVAYRWNKGDTAFYADRFVRCLPD